MGFRQLLNRAAKPEPAKLTELAELEREAVPIPTRSRPVAELSEMSGTEVPSVASREKNLEQKKRAESRRAPTYVWRSQRNLERGSEAVRATFQQF